MLTSDKLTLRNLVLAILAGSGVALLVGLHWIAHAPPIPAADEAPAAGVTGPAPGRPSAAITIATVTRPRADESSSVRSSAGGVAVSTTTLTSAEWDAGTTDSEPPAGAPRAAPGILRQRPAATGSLAAEAAAPTAPALPPTSATPAEPAEPAPASPVTSPRTSRLAPDAPPPSPPEPAAAMGAGRFTTDWPSPFP